jgi:hypothetical protein
MKISATLAQDLLMTRRICAAHPDKASVGEKGYPMRHRLHDLKSMIYANKETGLVIEATENYLMAYRSFDDGSLSPWSDHAVRNFADVENLQYLPLADLEDLAVEFAEQLTGKG